MQLIAMKFARIEGTEVLVQVNTGVEAKAAIKELRHKKKEIGLLKRRLAAELKTARAAEDRAERTAARVKKKKGFMGALARLSQAFKDDGSAGDVVRIEANMGRLDEIARNIDSCIIQIEGRLLK